MNTRPMAVAALLFSASLLWAAEHTLTADDAVGTSSFNSGLNWNDKLAPQPGETYLAGRSLRTPATGSHTFLGDSLTVTGYLTLKGPNNCSITVDDLILQGQVVNATGGTTQNLRGNILIPDDSAAAFVVYSTADRQEIAVHAPISGGGALNLSIPRPGSDMKAILLYGDNTAFTGPIHAVGMGKLTVTSETGLGGNPSEFSPRHLTLNGNTLRLDGSPATVLDDPNRGIWLSNMNVSASSVYPGGKFEVGVDKTATVACLIGGAGPFAKLDLGTLILSATNTYTGATAVSAGTLLINGATNATAALSVASGAALGGTGAVYGAATFASGASITLAGNGYGALTLASPAGVALNGTALSFDARDPADGPSDSLALGGPLTLSGANTVAVNFPASGLPAGTYTLATYPSLSGGGTLALVPPRYPNTTLILGPTALTLEITGSGSAHKLTWAGDAANNVWDAETLNWSPAGAVFGDGMDVLLDDAGVASAPVTLAADAAPRNVTVATTNKAYTLDSGAHTLTVGTLSKSGNAALTLKGTVLAGNGEVGTNGSSSDGGAVTLDAALTVAAGGIFTVRPSAGVFSQTAASVISGPGGLTLGSAATLSGTNTFTGVTTVGYTGFTKNITLHSPFALGSTNGGTVLRGGLATASGYNKLILAPGVTVTDEPLTVTNEGAASDRRAGLWMAADGAACWDGNITVAAASCLMIGVDNAGGTLTVGSLGRTVVTNAGPQPLVFRGAGTVALKSRLVTLSSSVCRDDAGTLAIYSSNNVAPAIDHSEGVIRLETENAFAAPPRLNIGKSATTPANKCAFDLNGHTLTLGGITDMHWDNHNGTANEGRQWILCSAPSTLILHDTADSSYDRVGSVMSGPLTFIKTGSYTLTVGHTNALSGAFVVSNGTVNVTADGRIGPACTNVVVAGGTLSLQNDAALSAAAAVTFAADGTGRIDLPEGVNVTVDTLWHGGKQRLSGTYGASASGARYVDDTRFSGPGILTVRRGNGGTVISVR